MLKIFAIEDVENRQMVRPTLMMEFSCLIRHKGYVCPYTESGKTDKLEEPVNKELNVIKS